MQTPICDFVRLYAREAGLRLHMPGHKGMGALGVEALDITEIEGADSLYEARGIIAQSEENASRLFGCPTFYSAEGSSQCIRAMVLLAVRHAAARGQRCTIAAGRNAHKTFLGAVSLLDVAVQWLEPGEGDSYLSCTVTAEALEQTLSGGVTAVYITSPDYLGRMADIAALSAVCRRHGALLLVDNAHGAYLRFLPSSLHPMDLGADMCCDSAHKTLPVLTGGAYLHVRGGELARGAKDALALFGSTSPSYLILQSLDAANACLAEGYKGRLEAFSALLNAHKAQLRRSGWQLCGDEPLKLTLCPKSRGYTGIQLAELLRGSGIECEFADPDFLVLMFTPEQGKDAAQRLMQALDAIAPKEAISSPPPAYHRCHQVMTPREAMLSPNVTLPAAQCLGRVLASPSTGCPPAVPIVVCGQRIDEAALESFAYYGIDTLTVIR